MEAEEEMAQDLLVSFVCQINDEEQESCGSAANFLVRMEMEGDPLGKEKVEGGKEVVMELEERGLC